MKNSGLTSSRVQRAFCLLFHLSIVLACIPQALASAPQAMASPQAMAANTMLIATPSNMNFGTVAVGSSVAQSTTLTNPGGPKISITNATLTGTGFSLTGLKYPITLAGGQSVNCTITFAPQVAGSFSGNLSITFYGGGRGNGGSGVYLNLPVPLSGTATTQGQLTPNPGSLNFGNVQVGNTQTLSETVSNSGGQTVNISQAGVSGAGFSITGLNPPLSLNPGQSVTFSASFAPQSAGSASGSISITSDAPNLTISLSGTGTAAGQLGVNPSSYNFGNVTVGTSASTSASLNASGATVTVNSVTFGDSEFSLSGISFPLSIPAGQSAAFTVTFKPQASGTITTTATFSSNAGNSPTVLSLSGTGTAPPQHSVNLSWNASQSQDVIGYNVYRGTASGGPYAEINSGLDSVTTYTDSSVSAGQTYYYVTTAVDSSYQESGYSNETTAVVPSP